MLALGDKTSRIYYGCVIVASTFVIIVAMIGPVFTYGVFLTPMVTGFGWGRAVLPGSYSVSSLLSGLLIGFVNSVLQVGSAIGPFAAGLIFDSTGNYHLAFLSCAAVAIIALIITVLLRPIRPVADEFEAKSSLKM